MSPVEPAAPAAPDPENEVKLTLWDHLRELRKRFVLASYGLGVGFLAVLVFVKDITRVLTVSALEALRLPSLTEAARAVLVATANAPGTPAGARGPLLECATQPTLSMASKKILEAFSATKGLQDKLVEALESCARVPSVAMPTGTFIYTNFVEPMMFYVRVGIYGGIFVAAPWILFQLWQFIAPGLYKKERRVVVPFLFFGTTLFYAGAAFCLWVVMPAAFPAMLQFGDPDIMSPMISLSEHLSLVMAMLLGFGVVFEVPVVIAFLSMVGLVTADWLSKYRRYAVIVNVIAAAIITPTGDPLNLALMAGPMIVFYEIGILLARLLGKKAPAAETAEA